MLKTRFIAFIIAFAVAVLSFPVEINAENTDTMTAEILFEVSTSTVISSKSMKAKLPIGVLSKLMTVLLCAEEIAENKLTLDTIIKVSNYANSIKGPTIWLMPSEEISVEDLLKGVIIGNANDACAALAEEISGSEEAFVTLMNQRADELGMYDSAFTNSNGFYDEELQISTAYDLALLARELYKYDFLVPFFTTEIEYIRNGETQLVNTNKLVNSVNGAIGYKFAATKDYGNCLVGCARREDEVYVSVLLGFKDKDECFSTAKNTLKNAFESYRVITPSFPENCPSEISVSNSFDKICKLEYEIPNKILLESGNVGSIKAMVILPEYVIAPIEDGQKVGEVHFYRDEKYMFSSEILSKEALNKKEMGKSFVILLKNMLSFC